MRPLVSRRTATCFSKCCRSLPGNKLFFSPFCTSGAVGTPSDSSTDLVVHSKLPNLPSYASKVSVAELLWSAVGVPDSAIAYECAQSGLTYSRGELFRFSKSFGAALIKAGLKRGDIVGILLPNCPQYAVISLGLLHAGLVASAVNPSYTPSELISLFSQAIVKAIVTIPSLAPVAQTIRNDPICGPSIKHIITIGAAQGCHNYFDMIKTPTVGTDFVKRGDINPSDETAIILWSSGTTGPPKGTMITHANICSSLLARSQPEVSNLTLGEETFVGIIPFFHIFGGMSMIYSAIYNSAKVVTLPKFESAMFTKVLTTHKPTYLHLVPPLVSFVASNPLVTKENLENIHTVLCGGAPSGPSLIQKFLEKAEKFVFFQEGYGMTETTGLSHVLLQDTKNTKVNSVGHPIANTSCKIVDISSGVALGPGQNGEICVKGPQVMKGYLNNDKATKITIDSEGWLHTGDVGYYTEDGLFYIVDRIKELIKVKGLQVSPTELEDILRKHDNIADVAVIGIPDARAGELPRAYIVPKKASLTANEIHEFLCDKVSEHKQLKGGVEFVDSIPKSPSGKCLRRVILENYRNKLK